MEVLSPDELQLGNDYLPVVLAQKHQLSVVLAEKHQLSSTHRKGLEEQAKTVVPHQLPFYQSCLVSSHPVFCGCTGSVPATCCLLEGTRAVRSLTALESPSVCLAGDNDCRDDSCSLARLHSEPASSCTTAPRYTCAAAGIRSPVQPVRSDLQSRAR